MNKEQLIEKYSITIKYLESYKLIIIKSMEEDDLMDEMLDDCENHLEELSGKIKICKEFLKDLKQLK